MEKKEREKQNKDEFSKLKEDLQKRHNKKNDKSPISKQDLDNSFSRNQMNYEELKELRKKFPTLNINFTEEYESNLIDEKELKKSAKSDEEYKIISEEEFNRIQKERKASLGNDGFRYTIKSESTLKKLSADKDLSKEIKVSLSSRNFGRKPVKNDWKTMTDYTKTRQDIEIISKLFKNREDYKKLFELDLNDELILTDLSNSDLNDDELWFEAIDRYKNLFKALDSISDKLTKSILTNIFGNEISQIMDYIYKKSNFDFENGQKQSKKLSELQKQFPKKEERER